MLTTIQHLRFYSFLWGIFLFTPLRGVLLLIMPFLVFLFNKVFILGQNKSIFRILMCIFFISFVISLIVGWSDWQNTIMSYWLFVPILYLFLSVPTTPNYHIDFDKVFNCLLTVIYIVDILGYIGLAAGASGFAVWGYSKHYEEAHGLAIVNLMFFFYFVSKIMHQKHKKKDILHAVFLGMSFYMCDFGMGWLFFFFTIFTFLFLQLRLKYIIMFLFFVAVGYKLYNSETFSYIKRNIEVTASRDENNARKAVMFTEVPLYLQENAVVPLFGCGPGAYNSRQTILICSSSDNPFTKLLGHHDPYYYKKYIYPLWNSTFVSMASYTDGTKNKPFSSFVSIMSEEGIVFAFILFSLWGRRIFRYLQGRKQNYLYTYLMFINIFFFIACIGHEWMVCTEFVAFLLLNYLSLNECYKRKTI